MRCGPRSGHWAAASSCAGALPTRYWRNWCARPAPRTSSGTGSTIQTPSGATRQSSPAAQSAARRSGPSTPASSSSPGPTARDKAIPIGCSRPSGDAVSRTGSTVRARDLRPWPPLRSGRMGTNSTTGACAAARPTGRQVCAWRGGPEKQAHAGGSMPFSPRVSRATTRTANCPARRAPAGCRRICTSARSAPGRLRPP